jgi:hypothetical protein
MTIPAPWSSRLACLKGEVLGAPAERVLERSGTPGGALTYVVVLEATEQDQ